MQQRRRFLQALGNLAVFAPAAGIAAGSAPAGSSNGKKVVKLTFAIINYTNRMIFDVALNGHGFGLAPPYMGSVGAMLSTALETGGPQTLTWRLGGNPSMARNGEVVSAKNKLFIREEDIPKGAKAPFVCVHIYPDDTAELTFTAGEQPQPTVRGIDFLKQREL